MAVLVRQVIDNAKMRHWALNSVQMPDGASLQYVNERQRAILLALIDQWEPMLSETEQILTALQDAALVAVDDDGVPYFATTRENGYAMQFEDGVPYIDTSRPFIVDPWGEVGDVPGLPLPTDVLRLMLATAVLDDLRTVPIDVFDEQNAAQLGSTRNLRAFINGNRLVPKRDTDTDWWSHVTAVRISFVGLPTLTALTDEITIPAPCVPAITAGLAEFLATAARDCPLAEKRLLADQAREALDLLVESADQLLTSIVTNHRVFRR